MADAARHWAGIDPASGTPSKLCCSLLSTLVTGFLEAGKTTLIKQLLTEPHGIRVAVIVNNLGAIKIDAGLIRECHGDTIDLENGCVCCTASNGLSTC